MLEFKSMEQVEKTPGTSVILFTAGWCPDCVFIKPFMPQIEKEYPDVTFYTCNRDDHIELCQQLNILGIPSFVAIKDGREIGRFVSKLRKTKPEIEAWLNETIAKGDANA